MKRANVVRVAVTSMALVAVLSACATVPTTAPQAGGAGVVAGQPTTSPAESGTSAKAAENDPDGVRVAIVGDSLTAGGGRLLSAGLTPNTWMTYAMGSGIDYVGGYAKGGSTIEEQAAAARPVGAVDALVLMSGTNDVRLGIPFDKAAPSYDEVVSTIGAAHVIVAGIPPYDRNPAAAARYEKKLEAFVAERGWTFVDPWGFARDGDRYAPGVSQDGIHPTTAGYRQLGENLRRAILDTVDRRGTEQASAVVADGSTTS